MNLKKIEKVFTSKFVGTGPSSCEKRIYRAAVSQRLRNTALYHTFVSQNSYLYILPQLSRPALWPTQPSVQWVPGGKERPGRESDPSPPSSAVVMKE